MEGLKQPWLFAPWTILPWLFAMTVSRKFNIKCPAHALLINPFLRMLLESGENHQTRMSVLWFSFGWVLSNDAEGRDRC